MGSPIPTMTPTSSKCIGFIFIITNSVICQEPVDVVQARDGGHHGGSGVEGAISKLDQQFQYLLSHISNLIGPAKYSLADDCQQNFIKTKTFGWSILGGGLLDTASDFFGNMRSAEDILTNADVGFSYVYNNAYGIGFGAPFLLPTYNPSCSYRCGVNDFLGVVTNYGLSNGVGGLVMGHGHGPGDAAALQSFGDDAKIAISCVVDQKGDSKQAAEIAFLIDDLVTAGVERLRLARTTP